MERIPDRIPKVIQRGITLFADRFREPPTDREIVQLILDNGFRNIVSVACSITDTIDSEWQDLHKAGEMRLVRAASEKVLPAIAMGMHIGSGGRENALMHTQNSGFSHAMDGLISFVETYDLAAGIFVTWRGSDATDISRPHQEIGKRTGPLTDVAINKNSVFGRKDGLGFREDLQMALNRVRNGGRAIIRVSPQAFRRTYPMQSVGPRELDPLEFMRRQDEIAETKGWSISQVYRREPISRQEAQAQVRETHPNAVIITGNGFEPRALYDQHHAELNLYQVGYMGSARALAYGMALINPHMTFAALEGDQNTQQGNDIIFNLVEYYPDNFFSYVLDNGRGSSVGTANSLPLAPDNYRYSRVIRTIPEQPGEFQAKRLEEGFVEAMDDDARAIIERVGPLPFHIRRLMNVIRQRTEENIARSVSIPPGFLRS